MVIRVITAALAEETKTAKPTGDGTEHGSLGELGAKLSDPTSDVVTYKTKKTTMGPFGQYWWSYAEYGNNSAGEVPATA